MFPCAPFSDIQTVGQEFSNLYFSAIVNDLHLYLVFGHIANKFKGTNPALKKPSNMPEIYAKMFGRIH